MLINDNNMGELRKNTKIFRKVGITAEIPTSRVPRTSLKG
jgi:hypothetical protein